MDIVGVHSSVAGMEEAKNFLEKGDKERGLRRVVFVSGIFNVLHPGHIRLLRFAKECGDRLVVAVLSDRLAGTSAHIPEGLRLEGVQSNAWVDEAFIMNEPVEDVVERLRPDVVVKGREHEARYNPERGVVNAYGGKLIFSSGEMGLSSVDLIRKEFSEPEWQGIELPFQYMERHRITSERLVNLLHDMANIRVCVVGDLIVDEYVTCQSLGMSQEDPTIVVTPLDCIRFVGGAGIVAAHAAGMGARVDFVTVTGDDSTKTFAQERLQEFGVDAHCLTDDSRPTTLKQRFRSQGKTLLRVSHLHQGAIALELQDKMLAVLESCVQRSDLLVFSDFNYGCLPQPLVDRIVEKGKEWGVMMVADSQSSSQIGDIARFKGMNLVTPTEMEARVSLRNSEDGLVILAEKLKRKSSAENILLKLGEDGLLIHSGGDDWLTDRVGALNRAPQDVAGAGDSLLIASALALASGGNIWEAACLGSLAAAIQVGRTGNTPIRSQEILRVFGG